MRTIPSLATLLCGLLLMAVAACNKNPNGNYGPPRMRHVVVLDTVSLPPEMAKNSLCSGPQQYLTHAKDLDTGQVYFVCQYLGAPSATTNFFY